MAEKYNYEILNQLAEADAFRAYVFVHIGPNSDPEPIQLELPGTDVVAALAKHANENLSGLPESMITPMLQILADHTSVTDLGRNGEYKSQHIKIINRQESKVWSADIINVDETESYQQTHPEAKFYQGNGIVSTQVGMLNFEAIIHFDDDPSKMVVIEVSNLPSPETVE